MNDMSMRRKHLYEHPEWNMSLTKDYISREIIVDDIEMRVVSEPLCECPARTK